MSLYRIINDWILNNYTPFYGNWIYFNATPYISGSVSTNTISGMREVSKDILGNSKKEITLAIDFVTEYDPQGTSDLNLNMMEEVDNFGAWVEAKNKEKDYPVFGEIYEIDKLEVLDSVPSLLVDSTQALAKYQIQIKFSYTQLN